MAAFNVERWIGAAVGSVLAQSFSDFELIVVDDGSTDGTAAIATATGDPRLRYVRQENAGAAAARNTGLELAQGEFVAVMDADDVSYPLRLEKQVRFMQDHPHTVVAGSYYQAISEEGKPLTVVRQLQKNYDIVRSLYNPSCPFCHSTTMYRTGAVRAVGGYNASYKIAHDYDLWCKIGAGFANIPEVLVDYRIHPTSLVQSLGQLCDEEGACAWQELWRRSRPPILAAIPLAQGLVAECPFGARFYLKSTVKTALSVERQRLRYHLERTRIGRYG
jgi:glycosyltransferase involved in cell wall biosynthesis